MQPGSTGSAQTAQRFAEALQALSAPARIRQVVETFGSDFALSTSFGATSAVLLDMVSRVVPGITVIYVRHGYETPETLDYLDWCREHFPIRLRIEAAPNRPQAQVRPGGLRAWCRELKEKPLRHALRETGAKVWLSGLIHDETPERRNLPLARERFGCLAVYPILDWSVEQAIQYCELRGLCRNERGFDPCKGIDQKGECGLHVDDHFPEKRGG